MQNSPVFQRVLLDSIKHCTVFASWPLINVASFQDGHVTRTSPVLRAQLPNFLCRAHPCAIVANASPLFEIGSISLTRSWVLEGRDHVFELFHSQYLGQGQACLPSF